MVMTDDPVGKPSANSKLCFAFENSHWWDVVLSRFSAGQDINKLSLSTEVHEYTALLLFSANTSFVGLYWSSAKVISILCQFWFVHYTKFLHSSSL